MPTRKEIISAILDDAKTRILSALKDIPGPSGVDGPAPRGAHETTMWRITQELLLAETDRPGMLLRKTYDELLEWLATDEEAPPEGKRDTRRQHAKRALDRFIERGWVVRDGENVSIPARV